MKIYKYLLDPFNCWSLNLPEGAKILNLQNQRDCPCLWALVDPTKPLEQRNFLPVMTGQDVSDYALAGNYVGMFQSYDGTFVAHFFEFTYK